MKALNRKKLNDLFIAETSRFTKNHSKSIALYERARQSMPNGVPMTWLMVFNTFPAPFVETASGAYFTDVDGHRYLDMNVADMSMCTGYAPEPVVEAISARMAAGGHQFLLPTEEAIVVSETLAERFGLPFWQYTLSASTANTEAIRLARSYTGKEKVLLFDGKYHGHIDATLVALNKGVNIVEGAGLPSHCADTADIVQFNDLDATESALKNGNIACIMTEPALTNCGVIMPEDFFLDSLRNLADQYGALLIIDETHTHVCAYGGLTRAWQLKPDVLVIGKSLSAGIPVGAYGLSRELATHFEAVTDTGLPHNDRLATGGTLFANPLSMIAARVTLASLLTEPNQERTAKLGGYLADGMERIFDHYEQDWTVHRLYCRSGFTCASQLPRNVLEREEHFDPLLADCQRIFMANRGIWEAITTAGPTVSIAASKSDVDFYLNVFEQFLSRLID
jgi:glutamate-1-semialdehyde 2,1-aminomutase